MNSEPNDLSRRGFGRRVLGVGAGAAGLAFAGDIFVPSPASGALSSAPVSPALSALEFDVRTFGAALDGVTDDAAAIQSAIDAASAHGGGVVMIPAAQTPAAGGGMSGNVVRLRSTLRMASGVWLRGLGASTVLCSTADPVIGFPTSGQVADRMGISDLLIESPSGVGIAVDAAGQNGGSQLGWPRLTVENVTITDAGSHAFLHNLSGVLETRWINCVSLRARGAGFNIQATDTMLTNCTAAASPASNTTWAGFQIGGANNKLVGCKSYGNAAVHGFVLGNGGRHVAVGCEAQDNGLAGFDLGAGSGVGCVATGCLSESNRTAGYLLDGLECSVSGSFAHQAGGGSGQITPVGFALTPGAARCSVDGVTDCATPVGGNVRGNSINVGVRGRQVLHYAPHVTPDPYAGDTVSIGLSGNMAIGAPSTCHEGQRMTFELTQDGAGRRVVSFSSRYRVAWSPVITPRTLNTITFEFDGLNWIQVGSATGLLGNAKPRISDSFNRSNGALGKADIGGKWQVVGPGRPVVSQRRFGVVAGNPGQQGIAVADARTPDARLTVTWLSVRNGAIIFRWQDPANYWGLCTAGIYKVVAGVQTVVQQGIGVVSNGDQFVVQCVGNSISVLQNGVVVASITDSDLRSATRFGLASLGLSPGASTDYFANFSVD